MHCIAAACVSTTIESRCACIATVTAILKRGCVGSHTSTRRPCTPVNRRRRSASIALLARGALALARIGLGLAQLRLALVELLRSAARCARRAAAAAVRAASSAVLRRGALLLVLGGVRVELGDALLELLHAGGLPA
jgi:hypothetical protein